MHATTSILVDSLKLLWESSLTEKSKIACQLLDKFRDHELIPWGLFSKILWSPLDPRHFLIIELLNAIPIKNFNIALQNYNEISKNNGSNSELLEFIQTCIPTVESTSNRMDFPKIFPKIIEIYQGAWELFRRNYSSAEKILQRWLYNHPNEIQFYPLVYLLMASVYRAQPALKRAIDCLVIANQIIPNNEVLLCRLGQVYGEMRLYTEANKYLTQAITNNPNCVEILLQIAWIALQQREFDIVEKNQSQALLIEPNNSNVLCAIGDYYSLKDENEKSLPYYEKAIEINPFFLQYYKNIGVTYLELKDFIKAETFLQKIVQLDPDRVEGWFALGWLKADQDDFSNALKNFQKALSLDNNNVEVLQDIADCYEKLDDQKKTISYLKRALSIDPKNVDVLWRLANIYFEDEKIDLSVDLWKKCLKIDPNHIQCLNSMGLYYDEYIDDFDKAKEYYQTAIEKDSSHYSIINLAQAYYNREMFNEAESVLQPILENTQDYRPFYYLGLIARDFHNQYQNAADLFQKALELENDNVLVTMDLVELYLNKLDQPQLAENLVQSLEKQQDNDPILKFFLDRVKIDLMGRKTHH